MDIALSGTIFNGSSIEDTAGFTTVVEAGTPADPDGNTTKGDFELAFDVESSFSFAGGGLIVRFVPTGPYVGDADCTQVLMYGQGGDASGYFVERFFADTDGVYPWEDGDDSAIGEVRFTYADGLSWYADDDGDGFGDPDDRVVSDVEPAGYVEDGSDCDDTDPSVSPDAIEMCDGVDNDCEGTVDGDDALDPSPWYLDADGDTYGDPEVLVEACDAPARYVADDSDCDDANDLVNPSADEVCNGLDDNCDGLIDDASATDAVAWYIDDDGDGFGAPSTDTMDACDQPLGYAATGDDCDDTRAESNPGADEYCNGYDDNCDGTVDEGTAIDAPVWYADADGDDFGDAEVAEPACDRPAGFVADATDCNDADEQISPAADEYCDAVDNDCDGLLDEDTSVDAGVWYADVDGDGYGDAGDAESSCDQPNGYVPDPDDCDDRDRDRNPAAEEIWYDDIDQDCDGNDDHQDSDGSPVADDCDDQDAERSPENEEIWYDGIDGDCGEDSDFDQDADGQESETYGGEDCDDADASVYNGAIDDPYDGLVTDCASAGEYDADADGYQSDSFGGDDCDDANSDIHPGAADEEGNGLDEDCDGLDAGSEVDIGKGGCGCATQDPGVGWLAGVAVMAVARRGRGRLRTGGVGSKRAVNRR